MKPAGGSQQTYRIVPAPDCPRQPGSKQWFTAAELAGLALPGLPKVKRKVNERAAGEGWALKVDGAGLPLARPRQGRGGGLEYHLTLLPTSARVELVKRGLAAAEVSASLALPADGRRDQAQLWNWYEGTSEATRAEARRRAAVIASVDGYERSGLTRSAAVACAAAEHEVAGSTLWAWLALVAGIAAADRLPHLAPRRAGGGAEAEIDADLWTQLVSDYLRPEKPTWASCYARTKLVADARGRRLPHAKTLLRKLEREVDGRLIIARREGAEALRRTLPPQQRSVADLHALELVNIDGHKFDVFTRFPARGGQPGRIGRPIMVAIQDVYSRKILAWRIGETESAVLTRLAFADLFRRWGIPKACLLDNGRAFASKWITGGAKSRFRFKIRDEEPTGILTALGVRIHWATPYRGQSKPIERAFRDLCDAIAKHPALAGAYTGNKPDAKPENYGSHAVELDQLQRIVAAGIDAHNARAGRRTETGQGRFSFDQVFAASYQSAAIGKASPEQLRMALLTADEVSADRQSGAISLFENSYWSPELAQVAGRKVTVRFDPDDLRLPIHVYDRTGRYLASAELLAQTGFLDAQSAKRRARQEAELRKSVRRQAELEQLMSAEQIAALLPDHPDEAEPPVPTVIRPVRHRGATAAQLRPVPASEARETPLNTPFIDRFSTAAARLRVVD
jgi:putative transposase